MKKKYFKNGMILCELNVKDKTFMFLGYTEDEITAQANELLKEAR